jgi:nicotinamidase-related amidase
MTMKRDLGVWTSEDCALLLIDYQKEMFEAEKLAAEGAAAQ